MSHASTTRTIATWVLQCGQLQGITDQQIFDLIDQGINALRMAPPFVDNVPVPVAIFGDLHGRFDALIRYFKLVAPDLLELRAPRVNLLFLGDYVDRGNSGLEIVVLLTCLKLLFPARITILRGNHECSDVNKRYGFYAEVLAKRNGNYQIWRRFNELFKEFPLCACVGVEEKRFFCMHGGLPRKQPVDFLTNPNSTQLEKPHNLNDVYDEGIANDLLWADPMNHSTDGSKTWRENKDRGTSILFSDQHIRKFLNENPHIRGIIRAHEHVPVGHQMNDDGNCCTLFSAPGYINGTDRGSVLEVSTDANNMNRVQFITLRQSTAHDAAERRHDESAEPRTPRRTH